MAALVGADWVWALYALAFSFCFAAFAGLNRYFKVEGHRLGFWRQIITFGMLLPVCFFIHWPDNPWFYAGALFSGVGLSISTAVRFNMAAQHNGRVATMFQPVQAFTAFFLWIALDPVRWQRYVDEPLVFAGILGCFALVSGAMLAMRRSDIGWATFIIIAPIGVLHAVMDVVAKIVLPPTDFWHAAIAFIVVSCVVNIVLAGGYIAYTKTPDKKWCPPGMMRAAVAIGGVGLLGFFCALASINLAPNPAYFIAIAMLAPVWLMLAHKLRGVDDHANPLAGMLMVVGAIALVLITNL